MPVAMKSWRRVALVLLACTLAAQEADPILQGTWTATAGARVFRGKWNAQVSEKRPNSAAGSWALFNDTGYVILEGTWTAEKTARTWRGGWTARTQDGRSFSGSWQADLSEPDSKTLKEMLRMTLEKEIGGWWRSGAREGNWWLKGTPSR